MVEDPRFSQLYSLLPAHEALSEGHLELLETDDVIVRTIQGNLVVKGWKDVISICRECFEEAKVDCSGRLSHPETATILTDDVDSHADRFGLAICSIDGQRWGYGDSDYDWPVQAAMMPVNFGIFLEMHGIDTVLNHVGMEPSGQRFDALVLDERPVAKDKPPIPHNPLVNAGAIMGCSLMEGSTVDDKIARALEFWKRICGRDCTVNMELYRNESLKSNRNRCIGYLLREAGSFPEGTRMDEVLEFYFMCCNIMQNAESMSLVAATLANGGVNPVTRDRVWSPETVRSILSVMFSCGMYEHSGRFAFEMGIPACSGSSGGIMFVIPNVMGMCTYSPRVDSDGNSVRGLKFGSIFAERFQIHNLEINQAVKRVLTVLPSANTRNSLARLIHAASLGDLFTCRLIVKRGGISILNQGDYDGRTPLHLACSENQVQVVRFFLSVDGIALSPVDRWGNTPIDEARKIGAQNIVKLFDSAASSL